MKKVVLCALLLATFAAVSAHAISGPRFGVLYTCYYNETFQTSGGSGTYIEFGDCTDGHSRTCWTAAP